MSWFIALAIVLIVGYAFYEGKKIFTGGEEEKVIPPHKKTNMTIPAKRWRLPWRK